ncbi:hypothetical protein L596_004821 [Steinernema carpocapsae]|uniref:Uncharacterized protein n=1 Tax=Steinernema carpocapsae TaxID=34508 RepID=A0A4U8UYI1_STECR|nr:hypothetical protein L596_004821 [Steinernema carpocapsae]
MFPFQGSKEMLCSIHLQFPMFCNSHPALVIIEPIEWYPFANDDASFLHRLHNNDVIELFIVDSCFLIGCELVALNPLPDLQLSNQPHLLRALLAGSPNGDSNDVRDYDNNLGQPGTSKSGDSLRLDEMSGSSPSFNPNEMNVMSYEIWMSKFNNKKKTSSASTRSESSAATASSIGSLASAASSSAASRKRSYDFIKNIDIKRESGAVFPGPKEKSGGAESDDGDFVTLPTIPPVRCKIRRQDDAMLAQQKPGWTESKESVNAEAQSAVHVICQPIPTFGTSTVPPLTMEHRSSQLPRTLPPSSLSGPTLGSFGIPTTPGVPQSAIARPSVVSHSLMPQLHPTFTTSSGNSVASGIPTPLTSGVVGSPIISATTPPSNQSAMEHLQNEVHFLKNYCQELQKQLHLQNQQTPAPPAFLPIASHLQFSSPSPVLRPMASAIPSSNQQYMDLMQQQLLMNSLGLCPKDFLDTLPGASANDKLGLAPMLNDGASLQSFVNQLSSLAVLAPAQTPIM